MDPFEVLGVAPGASTEQIEAAYRAGLRAWHPDLHQGEGGAALAEAERRTRELNEAMAHIRSGWFSSPPSGGDDDWSTPEPGAPWFRPPPRPRGPVPCPFCGAPFVDLASYEAHLGSEHRVAARTPRRSGGGATGRHLVSGLRSIPTWLVAMILIPTLLWAPVVLWIPPLALMALVLWAQTRPRGSRWR